MRFSSDQELFEENSNNNEQPLSNIKTPLKKKQKKETMLSKFLDSINQNVLNKLHNYEKLKRPIFQRRAIVPQKLSLYEDVLFILVFKQNQQKILSDSKQIKTICLDLQSRTKRKQCTIRQRLQKKLCKMSPQELLEHVANDKDISFNLKKVLTSGGKVESQKTISKREIDISATKQKIEDNNRTPQKLNINNQQQRSDMKDYDKISTKLQNSPSKQDDQIFYQKQDNKDQIKEEKSQQSSVKEINENDIFIVLKKNPTQSIVVFDKVLIQKQINELKKRKQQEMQRQELMKQLKIQMDIIMHFKNKTTSIPQQVKALIVEAQKIMKTLGISSPYELEDEQQRQVKVNHDKSQQLKMHEETADKNVEQSEKPNPKQNNHKQVSQFNIDQKDNGQIKVVQNQNEKYAISYALCNSDEYIKLYNSNPDVFEPLLWTEDQDNLIDKLIDDYKPNEKLFNLLIRYKGLEWFIERCIFLQKKMTNKHLNEAVKSLKPLNLSRLNAYLSNFQLLNQKCEQQVGMVEKIFDSLIEC